MLHHWEPSIVCVSDMVSISVSEYCQLPQVEKSHTQTPMMGHDQNKRQSPAAQHLLIAGVQGCLPPA